jgi:uncharacterized NAD-dependent epimerase/dehydratase family protein
MGVVMEFGSMMGDMDTLEFGSMTHDMDILEEYNLPEERSEFDSTKERAWTVDTDRPVVVDTDRLVVVGTDRPVVVGKMFATIALWHTDKNSMYDP